MKTYNDNIEAQILRRILAEIIRLEGIVAIRGTSSTTTTTTTV